MGFESRIFISAEQFAMSSSNSPSSGGTPASLMSSRPSEARLLSNREDLASTTSALTASQDSSSSGGGAANVHPLSQSREQSLSDHQAFSARSLTRSQDSLSGDAADGHVRFEYNVDVCEFDDNLDEDEDCSPLCDEDQSEEIPAVVIPDGMTISLQLADAIWDINDLIDLLNKAKRGETRLDPTELTRAIRDRIRLCDPTNDRRCTVSIFLKRLTSSLQRIGSDDFDINHKSNIVALIASGFIESEAVSIIEFFAGRTLKPLNPNARCLTSRDRTWYFYLFVQLKLTTKLLNTDEGVNLFFRFAVNPSRIPADWAQAGFSSILVQIYRRFASIRVKGLTKKVDRKQARDDSANADDAASQADSEFSSATQTPGSSPLWKNFVAIKTLSELLNRWLEDDILLCQGRGELTEAALLKLIFRFLKRMQCSKTGTFDTDRMYSAHIYEALMKAYWTAKNAGKKLILRLHDTFSALLCATCNYAAAYEWLVKAIACIHLKDNKLTADETALINFALSASAMGAQTLATCSTRNMQALFLHFFHGDELRVSGTDAAKIQSAIDRVAKDFERPPFEVVEPDCHAAPKCDSTHESDKNGGDQAKQPIAEFRGRGDQQRGRFLQHRGSGLQRRGRSDQ
jgi:hypothetical protein